VIITRTPFRVSFFGGGTDYPIWYREHGGSALAMAIDKYCYISCRYLPPFFEHKSRVAYTRVETVASNSEIQHPAVRAVLEHMRITDGVEVHYDADLPARTGLGTSSAFTVGLLHATYALQERMISKAALAQEAIHIEQVMLKENVGCQDQIIAAHGGLCRIVFAQDDSFYIEPIILPTARVREFTSHLLLCFTGNARTASSISGAQIRATPMLQKELDAMGAMVDEGIRILNGGAMRDFGALLDESWNIKRMLTTKITSPRIDQIYAAGREAGAYGGKLLGAGGGGFLLFFAEPERHPQIRANLRELLHIPVGLDTFGSSIVLFSPETTPVRVGQHPMPSAGCL
jgi:D-glycero-alpha-D-manno-heptose-7-phosphate kinase